MSLDRFESHLRDPAPGFRCFAAGDRSKKIAFLAKVQNRVGAPASAKALATVDKLCSSATPLKRFVKAHDGVVLYRDSKSDAAGVEFFKAANWRSQTTEMRDRMIEMGFEEEDMPEWFNRGIAFGQIPGSANYFVIQPDGDAAGQVFYCSHDGFKTEPMAASFEDLLRMIVKDPPRFLYNCGCYTRYSDGKTNSQWIPTEYVADCSGG